MSERNLARVGVLFVCLGNICRSPTAHGVFQHKVSAARLGRQIAIDSCGTGNWHVGQPPDSRATAAAYGRGYDLSSLRARQIARRDFQRFDYILAMDESNLNAVQALAPPGYAGQLGLLLDCTPRLSGCAVPDPYYGGEEGFDEVLDLVEAASEGLLKAVLRDHF